MFWIILLISDDQGQERDSLSCPRGHLKHAVTSGIEGSWGMIMSRGQLTLWNTLTLEIAHITSNKTIMSSLLIKECG
jgi:hypothetical protein